MAESKKSETVHVCQNPDCKKEFPGTGKKGRPFKFCPACRAKK